MSIFQIDEAAQPQVRISRLEKQWIDIGVEWYEAKAKGKSSREFAAEKDINYSTFTRGMTRYKAKIQLAHIAAKASKKPQNKLTRAEREAILINSFRQSMREKIKNSGASVNNKSEKWFKETLAKGVRGHSVVTPKPGKLYAFIYDAKHKDKLPYWDKYPLIVFLGVSRSKNGSTLMHGLNLHYIPPKARQQFLEDLLKQYSSTTSITNNTTLKIDWSKVKGFKGADQMIKSYLPSHVKGKFVEIKPSDWANVVLLPLQQFVSQGTRFSASKVWKR